MAEDFTVGYDSSSLASINKLIGFQQSTLIPALGKAQVRGADVLISTIPQVTEWKNGSGRLDSSFVKMDSTPYSINIGSPLAYAARRNFSFKGPDSLGRMFPNDPAAHYAEKAIDVASPQIEDIYVEEIQSAIDAM